MNHDKLMKEYLMSADSVDPSLGRLQAARLANSVVAWLNVQARQIERLPMQAEDDSARSSAVAFIRFGLVKNRFLWSADEDQCPLYVSLDKIIGNVHTTY